MKKALRLFLCFYCVFLVLFIIKNHGVALWDFRHYYYAAEAFAQGRDPYIPFGNPVYIYPYLPWTLQFFKLFLPMNCALAECVFLLLNCAVIAAMLYIGVNYLLERKAGSLFYLLCLLGFNGTVYLGLRSGNAVFFEQFLILLALCFFLKRNYLGFCAAVVFAASIKLSPIVFLFLLFFSREEKRVAYFICSLAAFGGVLALSYLFHPAFVREFFAFVATIDERGIVNPSTLSLVRDVFQVPVGKAGNAFAVGCSWAAYALAVAGIVLATSRKVRGLEKTDSADREKIAAFLFCFMYALIVPRMKDYSYVVLLIPTYYMIARSGFARISPFYTFLAVVPCVYVPLPGMDIAAFFLWSYYPLVIAFFFWGLYLRQTPSLSPPET